MVQNSKVTMHRGWLFPNRNVFSLCWKHAKFMSCRRCGGKHCSTETSVTV